MQRLLAGEIGAEHFASTLATVSRERAVKFQAALVAHIARRGHLHRTLLSHLNAMAAVLAPSGMLLAQHAYKVQPWCMIASTWAGAAWCQTPGTCMSDCTCKCTVAR